MHTSLKHYFKAILICTGLVSPLFAGPSQPPAGNYINNVSTNATRQIFNVSSGTVTNLTILGTCTGPGCGSGGGGGSTGGSIIASTQNNVGYYSAAATNTINGSSNLTNNGSLVTIATATISSTTVSSAFYSRGSNYFLSPLNIDNPTIGVVDTVLNFNSQGFQGFSIDQPNYGTVGPPAFGGLKIINPNGSTIWIDGGTPTGIHAGSFGVGGLQNGTSFYVNGNAVIGKNRTGASTTEAPTDGLFVLSGIIASSMTIGSNPAGNATPVAKMLDITAPSLDLQLGLNNFLSYYSTIFSSGPIHFSADGTPANWGTNTDLTISSVGISAPSVGVTYGISAGSLTVTGTGNFQFVNAGDANTYQVVGSSTVPTAGHLAVWSSSAAIIDGGPVGSSGGGSTGGSIVASTQANIAYYSSVATNTLSGSSLFQFNGTSVTVVSSITVNTGGGSPANNDTVGILNVFGGANTVAAQPLFSVGSQNVKNQFYIPDGSPINMAARGSLSGNLITGGTAADANQNSLSNFAHSTQLAIQLNDGSLNNMTFQTPDSGSGPGDFIFKPATVEKLRISNSGALTVKSSSTFSGTVNLSSGVLLSGAAGSSGQFLTSGGAGTIPTWTSAAAGGNTSTMTVLLNSVVLSSPTTSYNYVAGTGQLITGSQPTANSASLTFSPDTAVMLSRATDQANTDHFCHSTVAGLTMTCTMNPTLTLYTTGQCFTVISDSSNLTTAAATLNIDTLGALSILSPTGVSLSTGTVNPGIPFTVCHSSGASASWIMQSGGGSGGGGGGTITLTGDVTGSGTSSIGTTAAAIQANIKTFTSSITVTSAGGLGVTYGAIIGTATINTTVASTQALVVLSTGGSPVLQVSNNVISINPGDYLLTIASSTLTGSTTDFSLDTIGNEVISGSMTATGPMISSSYFQIGSKSLASITTSTPTVVGQGWYCTTCTTDAVCVGTQTVTSTWSRMSSKTTACQ